MGLVLTTALGTAFINLTAYSLIIELKSESYSVALLHIEGM